MSIEHLYPIPNLTTALAGPLREIEARILDHQPEIESWFRRHWLSSPAPIYCSVDLRNAGFKLAPVDTNLFPAGFNNLNPAFLPLCIHAVQSALEHMCPTANRILLIPESHTRNIAYSESVATIQEIFSKAGFETRIGTLVKEFDTPQKIALPSGRELRLDPVRRNEKRLMAEGFDPCAIVLNNDFSGGYPELLSDLEQIVLPPLQLTWASRLKSDHFSHYHDVVQEFSHQFDLDPWLIEPLFRKCGEINFMKREGEECLAKNVTALLDAVERKYHQYGIKEKPYVVVKADAGTYGMGVMTVYSAQQIKELNRKQRTRMAATKGGTSVTRVLLQEGVPTFETWGESQAVAEPVVYMIDHFVVGGFYRVHTERGPNENLNAPGMHFEPLAFAETCVNPDQELAPDASPNRFYAYGVVARLALLAAARELAAAGSSAQSQLSSSQ